MNGLTGAMAKFGGFKVFTCGQTLAAGAYLKHFLDHVTREAQDHSVVELRLYADTRNQRAHSTYMTQGFTTGHYQVFEKPIT